MTWDVKTKANGEEVGIRCAGRKGPNAPRVSHATLGVEEPHEKGDISTVAGIYSSNALPVRRLKIVKIIASKTMSSANNPKVKEMAPRMDAK